jgi:hypothetical protein
MPILKTPFEDTYPPGTRPSGVPFKIMMQLNPAHEILDSPTFSASYEPQPTVYGFLYRGSGKSMTGDHSSPHKAADNDDDFPPAVPHAVALPIPAYDKDDGGQSLQL